MQWANNKREALKEDWATGAFSGQQTMEMLCRNAGATGAASILADLLAIDYVEIEELGNE